MAARPDVAANRAQCRRPLEEHLPDEEDERARRIVAVREERPIARIGLLLLLHPADGENHVVRLAREQVSAARAAVGQQPDAGPEPPLDLGAVRRRRAGHQRGRLLFDPAERGDVLVRAEQDPGLAGARLRGEIGLPLRQPVRLRQPAGHRRRVAVAHRSAQHGQCQPVDLEVDDPRDVGAGDDPLPAGDPTCDPDRGRVVGAEEHRKHDAHCRDDERGEQGPPEVVDLEHTFRHVGGDQEDERICDQDEQEAEHERQRQPQRGEHGRDHRVQRRDDHRDDEGAQEALDVDAGQEARSHHQRDAGAEPGDEEREEPQARSLGPPGSGVAVGLLGGARHRALHPPVRTQARHPRRRRRGDDGTGSDRTPHAPLSSPPSSRRAVPSARRP